MKKTLFLLLLPVFMQAQTNWLQQNIQFSEADSNKIEATISGKAFELMSHAKPDTLFTDEIMQLAKSIEGVIGYAEFSTETMNNLFAKANTQLEEYASMTKQAKKMALFINQKSGVVTECLLLVKAEGENMAALIYGNMDMRLFGELYKLMPYQYMKELQTEKHAQ